MITLLIGVPVMIIKHIITLPVKLFFGALIWGIYIVGDQRIEKNAY